MTALTPEIVAAYTAGDLSLPGVGAALGCSSSWAMKLLRDAGVDTSIRRRGAGRHTGPLLQIPAELVEAARRYEMTIRQIADRLGRSYGGVRQALARAGVRKGNVWADERRDAQSAFVRLLATESGDTPLGRVWTEEEDSLLGTDTDARVAKLLGRTPGACSRRRARLRVKKFEGKS